MRNNRNRQQVSEDRLGYRLEQHPEIRKLLDQYRDKNGRLAGMEIENAFSKGFRLGALFMIDVFKETV